MAWKEIEQDGGATVTDLAELAGESDAQAAGVKKGGPRGKVENGAWLVVISGERMGVFKVEGGTRLTEAPPRDAPR